MAVYVDPLMTANPSQRWPFTQACHMIGDSLEELHRMASQLGLKREWFQTRSALPHYDLTPNKRKLALRLGAKEITLRDMARRVMEAYGRYREI